MRIRAIFLAVVLLSILPSAFIGFWSHESSLEREVSDAYERSMMLANSLKTHIQRYQDDIRTLLNNIAVSQTNGTPIADIEQFPKQLHITRIATVDYSSGRILSQTTGKNTIAGSGIDIARIRELKNLAIAGETAFSPVMAGMNGINVMYAMQRHGDTALIVEIDTSVFVQLASLISIGDSEHAAIIDKTGKILAHPSPRWVAERRNLSGLSPVKHMKFGSTGIDTFFSPSLGQDVMAAYTTVPGSDWGIMVPQTVASIQRRAAESQSGLVFALLAGVFIAILSGFLLSRYFVKPLELMSDRLRIDANRLTLSESDDTKISLHVYELAEVHNNYNLLVRRISQAQDEVERMAYFDTVTGLANRDNFNKQFEKIFARARSSVSGGALIYVDLDNFKQVNDVYGHEAGDKLLMAVADTMRKTIRIWHNEQSLEDVDTPVIARMGGDEFAILIPGLTDADRVDILMGRLGNMIARCSTHNNQSVSVGSSIGCARYPADGETCEQILKRADMAMYKAKNSGRGRHILFNTEHGILTPGEIRHEITNAIKRDELRVFYQPQLCAKSRRVLGVEALVRWNHTQRGLQVPDLWLPEIADSPIIIRLGEWVAERALADLSTIHKSGRNISAAINIGARHFLAPGFTGMLESMAKRFDIATDRIEVEVTEETVFQSTTHAQKVLNELRELGFRLSIDDFGKGFSNMARLAELPVDYLKIDRSIVEGAQKNPRIRTILASSISMAHDLGCGTIAEGVETISQADFTTDMGADVLQGYYFAQPMPLDEFLVWLEAWEAETITGINKQLLEAVA